MAAALGAPTQPIVIGGNLSASSSGSVTKYDTIIRHIRELGLQLAINPEYEVGKQGHEEDRRAAFCLLTFVF